VAKDPSKDATGGEHGKADRPVERRAPSSSEAAAEARRQLKRELERTKLLQDVTSSATSSLSLDEIGRRVLDLVCERLGSTSAIIYAISQVANELRALAVIGYPEEVAAEILMLPIDDESSVGHMMVHDLPLITHETTWIPTSSASRLERMRAEDRRWVALPIPGSSGPLGAFVMVFDGARPFSEDELSLYRSVADLLGAAFTNARMFQSENRRAARLQALQTVSGMLTSSLDVWEFVGLGLEEVVRFLDVTAASLWVLSASGERLELIARRGFPDEFAFDFASGLPLDAPHDVVQAFHTGEPIVHNDARQSDVAVPVKEAYARYGIPLGSLVALPLRSRSGVIGGMTLAWGEPRTPTGDDLVFDMSLADAFAGAIENSRLFDAEQRAHLEEAERAHRLSALRDIAEAASSSLDVFDISARIVEAVRHLFSAQQVQLRVLSDDGQFLDSTGVVDIPGGYLEHLDPLRVDAEIETAACFRTRVPRIEGNAEVVSVRPGSRRNIEVTGVRSFILLPLVAGSESIGTFYVAWTHTQSFVDEEVLFLESVAAQFVAGLQNARMFRAEELRARRMAALRDIADLGASALGVHEFVTRLARTIQAVLKANRVLLTADTDGKGWLVPIGNVGWSEAALAEITPAPPASPILEAYTNGAVILISDVHAPEVPSSVRERAGRIGSQAIAVAPLIVSGEPVGTISVGWEEARRFDSEETAFLESIASQAAVGLQNAHLLEAEREARAQADSELGTTRLLLEATQAISGTLELREVLERFADVALRLTGLTRVFVNLVDTDAEVLTTVVATGGVVTPRGREVPFDQLSHTFRAAIVAGHTTALDFELPDLSDRDRAVAQANACRLALFVPLLVAGRIVGHATLDDPGKRHDFTPREIELVEGMAAQAAVVVRNAELYDAAQRHSELDRMLAEAAGMLASSLESEAVWPDVLALASEALGAASGMLVLKEGGGWRVVALRNLPGDLLGRYHEESEVPTLAQVGRSREPQFVPDVDAADAQLGEWARKLGYRSFITCPVLGHGDVMAALVLCFEQPRAAICDDEMYMISRIAFMVGVAEENARLYRREHEIAETLQEGLLALPMEMPGVEFAQAYRSATEGSRVGGDFYDLFQLSEGQVGITVGDVSGKGLSAAVVTALVKNTVRAHATEKGKTPGVVLSLTGDVVYRSTSAETFVTVFFGVLDCRSGTLTFANAAHTTGAVVRADGNIGELGVTGPLLGAFGHVAFGEGEAMLEAGDTLFLYTDGLTESRRDGVLYGEARLMELLSGFAGRTPQEVVDAVVADVEAYSGSRLRDDMAILAVRRTASGPSAVG
jgi:GAF domain-containing protein